MTFAEAWEEQGRVIRALIKREIDIQASRMGLGLIMTVLEPLAHISVATIWFTLVRINAPYGTSKVLFIASGLMPIFIFIHLSAQSRSSMRQGLARRLPKETALDFVIARSVVRLTVYMASLVLLFAGIYVFITPEAMPDHLEPILLSIVALTLFGLGFGLCNTVLDSFVSFWRYIWGAISRSLILFSGVLFVPDALPLHVRNLVVWNPLLHAVELFRSGIYPRYPKLVFSPLYMWAFAGGVFVLGMCLQHVFKRRLDQSA